VGSLFFANLAFVVCGQWRVGEGGIALVRCGLRSCWCLYLSTIAGEMVVVGIDITG
jgi:hypothetical protein